MPAALVFTPAPWNFRDRSWIPAHAATDYNERFTTLTRSLPGVDYHCAQSPLSPTGVTLTPIGGMGPLTIHPRVFLLKASGGRGYRICSNDLSASFKNPAAGLG